MAQQLETHTEASEGWPKDAERKTALEILDELQDFYNARKGARTVKTHQDVFIEASRSTDYHASDSHHVCGVRAYQEFLAGGSRNLPQYVTCAYVQMLQLRHQKNLCAKQE